MWCPFSGWLLCCFSPLITPTPSNPLAPMTLQSTGTSDSRHTVPYCCTHSSWLSCGLSSASATNNLSPWLDCETHDHRRGDYHYHPPEGTSVTAPSGLVDIFRLSLLGAREFVCVDTPPFFCSSHRSWRSHSPPLQIIPGGTVVGIGIVAVVGRQAMMPWTGTIEQWGDCTTGHLAFGFAMMVFFFEDWLPHEYYSYAENGRGVLIVLWTKILFC